MNRSFWYKDNLNNLLNNKNQTTNSNSHITNSYPKAQDEDGTRENDQVDESNVKYYFLLASATGNESVKTLIGNPIPISKSIAKLFTSQGGQGKTGPTPGSTSVSKINSKQWVDNDINKIWASPSVCQNFGFNPESNQNLSAPHMGALMEVLFNHQQQQQRLTPKPSSTAALNIKNSKSNSKVGRTAPLKSENLLSLKSLVNSSAGGLQAFLPFKSSHSKIACFKSSRGGHLRLETGKGSKKAPEDDEEMEEDEVKFKFEKQGVGFRRSSNGNIHVNNYDNDDEGRSEDFEDTEADDEDDDSFTESDSDQVTYGRGYPEQSRSVSGVSSDDEQEAECDSQESDNDVGSDNNEDAKNKDSENLSDQEKEIEMVIASMDQDLDQDQDNNYLSATESFLDAETGYDWSGLLHLDSTDLEDDESQSLSLASASILDLNCKDYFKNASIMETKIPAASSSCSRSSRASANSFSICNKKQTDNAEEIQLESYFKRSSGSRTSGRSYKTAVSSMSKISMSSSKSKHKGVKS